MSEHWLTRAGYTSAALLLGMTLPGRGEPQAWQVGAAPLLTRWAAEVRPDNAHPEYPRPQLVRADWQSLNGLWDYAITPSALEAPTNWEGKILVPFPVESALSGVMRRLDEKSTLWYRRQVAVPAAWRGRRVRLHFEAVDWEARVWVNGRFAGEHRGGFDRFGFDVTDHLRWEGQEEITVAVTDPTEGDQPRGKQSRKPEGIFYTPCSGIWQPVWLEPVPTACVDRLQLTPDVDAKALRLRVAVGSLRQDLRVEAVARAAGREVGRVTGQANSDLWLPIAEPRLWSPDDPFLYDLEVRLLDNGGVLDSVSSYFGMRKIALRKDAQGVTRIALNDRILFQVGTLDQGFWPDGIYTAPTDAALRSDIEFLKEAGFNLTRKHVKVEPDRWYYWCDKLGLLVWQDMPSGNNATDEGRRNFENELRQMIAQLGNHPSIIVWVVFNEGWGQYDTERLTAWVKSLDPSRLVDNASGWTDARVGDLVDLHSYPGPQSPPPEANRAAVLGEFGGLGYGVPGHMWKPSFWGYQTLTNTAALAARYQVLLGRVWNLHETDGLSAAVYTQTTDVETECNGLLTYDRAVRKLDPALLRAANTGLTRTQLGGVISPVAFQARALWRFTTNTPPANWYASDFDDSAWPEGYSGFGRPETPGAVVRTAWRTTDIWLRRPFTMDRPNPAALRFLIHHDEDVEVYLNGVPAAAAKGFITDYVEMDIRPEALAALRAGTNVLAVHCHQTGGGQYVDVGITIRPADPSKGGDAGSQNQP